ncbi:MAG: pilus assembly protein TadG-related protein, partial [Anaerolineae bacterium]|nr:pilus assembly protein TadG-related protein [Anaerolineae bacterium]
MNLKRAGRPGRQEVPAAGRDLQERGQTLVLVAVMLVGLVSVLALVIDMGNVYSQRRFMQNAADAAALAGARALALGKDVAQGVHEYAIARNGAQSCQFSVVGDTVAVTVHRSFPTYFAGVVGVPTSSVSAVAVAGFEPVQEI